MPFDNCMKSNAKREIVYVSTERLKPFEGNPRNNDDAVPKVRRSIETFGFVNPIIVDKKYRICAGHTRYKAALEMGLTEVPVIIVPDLIGKKFEAFNITDNKTGEIAEWNDDKLGALIKDLSESDFDTSVLGYTDGEISQILKRIENKLAGADPDDVPEPPKQAITKPGDLWILGEHRLLCGDATNADDVTRLLDGQTPFIMVTDPPYGVDYDPAWRDDVAVLAGDRKASVTRRAGIANDTRVDWSAAWLLFTGSVAYIWHDGKYTSAVQATIEGAGFEIRCQVIWAKSNFPISRGHYHWRHEPCWYAVKTGSTANWCGDRKQTTLWEINPDKNDGGHPTQKPVECMERPIRNHGAPGEGVYDTFVGSGTTIIAAERTGRRCFAMEIDPIYCDVSVKRWETFTGKKAVLQK